ncbi:hypothetical protein TTHERM_00741650 (macronuclear) [Tetrahymena thermophila SB210]|uniref:Uncharacterized protein n=1 Tax=Tetrahymena thermophila (strain SB210) TaxID=312017 RepID=Q239W6_TETTS|nr:hypothetical protein TTHERM_00741650 [Tetrahymena thermophila SB210]EAR93292.2 hypothetical protein TTHERM_00741650 [Tetrahymena thermophila SB210]|eukprot:XP_001013537.2 hypothetical protein TTHERM_00741650 [Tetrahymena thermophila SB210]
MTENCNFKDNYQNINIHLYQNAAYREQAQASPLNSRVLYQNTESLCYLTESILYQMDTSIQGKCQREYREIALKSKNSSDLSDSYADIEEDDTKETINSINSLNIKNFSCNSGIYDLENRFNKISNYSTNHSQIFKSEVLDQDQKQSGFLFQIPKNQSQSFIDDYQEESEDQGENQNKKSLNNSICQKSENSMNSSMKSSIYKRVTFEDLSQKNYHHQFSQNNLKRTSKSILKRSQTFDKNQNLQRDVKDTSYQSDMDFVNIIQEKFIQQILEKETCNSNDLKQHFFSELATKISSSGEKKKRIIFLTYNSFFVLQDLHSYKYIQRFNISDINKITIHSDYQNVCSILLRNSFKLNLQINHFNEFIQFIKNVFNSILKTFLPIIQKQKQKMNEDPKINDNNYTQLIMQSFLSSQKEQFYVKIQIMSNNIPQSNSKILGILQFFQNEIYITAMEKSSELKRFTQVILLDEDLQQKSFNFQSLKKNLIFNIKLLIDSDFPLLIQKIQDINKYQIK